ncbi:MerR family transcriptional regulator [Agaricicola taiwanensis]|uniref:MerR family transcriptional regulator n=1 Tax=Agaricicola taiwanensis TaxID=591372 RepID=A0A8J3DUQ3_9RHOB|nr:MerR family transcriptional regulator [Agaricicola taiwanensis]GGE46270.1 MerR family transcriptional regulator [Agaricicola taiwanensis]
MDKGPEAFRTISEVADDLDLPQHVLRFWETRFSHIKPLKRGGGRRYYRPDDVTLLRGIKHLLYGEGYTIKGVQRILREQGPHHVMTLWRELEDEEVEMAPVTSMPEDFAPQRNTVRTVEPQIRAEPQISLHDEEEDLVEEVPPSIELAPASHQDEASRAAEPRQDKVPERVQAFAPENARKLQLTLFELLECKEILDAAR